MNKNVKFIQRIKRIMLINTKYFNAKSIYVKLMICKTDNHTMDNTKRFVQTYSNLNISD